MTPAERVIERLVELKLSVETEGKGWVSKCPRHAPLGPVLYVADSPMFPERPILFCRSQSCPAEFIATALGLSFDLLPRKPRRQRRGTVS